MKRFVVLRKPVPDAIKFALVQQLVVLVLANMVLDGGALAQICFSALVAYWAGALLVMARRGAQLTRVDTLLIRWSYIPLCIASYFITQWIWSWVMTDR